MRDGDDDMGKVREVVEAKVRQGSGQQRRRPAEGRHATTRYSPCACTASILLVFYRATIITSPTLLDWSSSLYFSPSLHARGRCRDQRRWQRRIELQDRLGS